MKTRYKARQGAPFSNKDAQNVGDAVSRLKNRRGEVTPKNIVEYARDENSPLHRYFEWDDNEASKQFRLQQAKNIVNHIVEIVVIGTEQVEQRSFFSVETSDKRRVYVTVKQATEVESYKSQLLSRAITQLENLTVTLRMFKGTE